MEPFLFPQCTIRIRSPRCDAAVSRRTRRTAARATTPPPLPPRRPGLAAAIPAAAAPRKAPPPTTKIGTEYRPTYPAALGISDVDPDLFRRWSFLVEFKGFSSVLWIRTRIRARRIRMFLGLQEPDPDPLVRGTDPRIRICTKMSWIPNTSFHGIFFCSARFRRTFLDNKNRVILVF